jgi:hypothetical protein
MSDIEWDIMDHRDTPQAEARRIKTWTFCPCCEEISGAGSPERDACCEDCAGTRAAPGEAPAFSLMGYPL